MTKYVSLEPGGMDGTGADFGCVAMDVQYVLADRFSSLQ